MRGDLWRWADKVQRLFEIGGTMMMTDVGLLHPEVRGVVFVNGIVVLPYHEARRLGLLALETKALGPDCPLSLVRLSIPAWGWVHPAWDFWVPEGWGVLETDLVSERSVVAFRPKNPTFPWR